jgi:hypothetical protein
MADFLFWEKLLPGIHQFTPLARICNPCQDKIKNEE